MVYAVIAAGGIGSRMGNTEKPKQYIMLGNKPVIAHTVGKFFAHSAFARILILCPRQWVDYTREILKENGLDDRRIVVLEGGDTRNETIMNAVRYIEETDGLDEQTVIVTHDAVRPLVTERIITDNIAAAQQYGASDTVVPATDTIVESRDHKVISNIPDRSILYQGQTPQAFRAKQLKQLYESLTAEEKDILTDACKIFSMKGYPVHLVNGEVYNIKITYPYDLRVAEVLLETE